MKEAQNEWPLQKPTQNDLFKVEIDYAYGLGFPEGYSEIYSEKIDGVWVNVVSYPETFCPSLAKGLRTLIFINGRKAQREILSFSSRAYSPFEVVSSIVWGR